MSDNDPEAAEFLYNVQIAFVDNYCMVAAASLIVFEHCVTLQSEIELVWHRKFTAATLLFFLNRWFNIGVAVGLILPILNWRTQPVGLLSYPNSKVSHRRCSCEATTLFLPVFQELSFVIWAAFSALRVFAVGGHNRPLAALVFALGLVPVATNLYGDVKIIYTTIDLPILGIVCNNDVLVSETAGNICALLLVTRLSLIVSDIVVLLVTWFATYNIKRDADRCNLKVSVVTLLLRDGTIYFVLLLILNILHMILYITNVFVDMSYFVGPISSIIISRFLLNLRQVSQEDVVADDARPSFVRSHLSDLQFARSFVGNMGAPLSHGLPDLSKGETGTFGTIPASGSSDAGIESPADDYGSRYNFDAPDVPRTAKNPLAVDIIPTDEIETIDV